ncbi:MAG: hypothetical protein MUE60_11570 [Candidatus Eisenbacteria bacterium]|nr:hypothetical protein [Candidatus Eisenbacteria bacterium]
MSLVISSRDPGGLGQGGGLIARPRAARVRRAARVASGFALLAMLHGTAAARYIQARLPVSECPPFPAEDLDIIGRKGDHVWVVTDSLAVERLRASGVPVEIEVGDMERTYAGGVTGPAWGAYHTLAETEAFLDSLHGAHPAITSPPFTVGTSVEGRPIRAMKISDNPCADEDEPKVLFDGLHHAREMMSVETILDFAGWLCAAYPYDPVARAMVDGRELFILPVVNPDGMAYNEAMNPGGGGMWRKNRRDNGDGTFGVDLNRNYPFQWGLDNGSSPVPSSSIYRGPSPASEPETQAMISFIASGRFSTHVSMHSFLGATLIPWGYTSAPTPHDDPLRAWGRRMSSRNGYVVAQPAEVLYLCSGMMLDWAYGETESKDAVISTTIEVGGSGFWPAESEVPELLDECRWPLLYAAQSAGAWLAVAGWGVSGGNGDGRIDPGETVCLTLEIENRAFAAHADAALVTVMTDDAYVQLHEASSSLIALAAGDTAATGNPLTLTVDAAAPEGHVVALMVRIVTGGFRGEESVRCMVGRPPGLFFDDFERGQGAWVATGTWEITNEDACSPSGSMTDSPGGDYENYTDSWIRLAQPLDLSLAPSATLSFWQRRETEESYDHCVVEASADGGASWRQVGPQYSGTSHGWERVELPLDGWATPSFTLRFRLETDVSITSDGWHVDDVLIVGPAPGNLPPAAPAPVSPPNGSVMDTPAPVLTVAPAADPDGDALACGFFLYADSLFLTRIASSPEVPAEDDLASWRAPHLADGVYWWRAYAFDGVERGPLCAGSCFRVGALAALPRPAPSALSLHCAPNPCRGVATMIVTLPAATSVRLGLHDLAGRRIRDLGEGHFAEGPNRVTWDGRDYGGALVPAGVYLVRLSASGSTAERFLIRAD